MIDFRECVEKGLLRKIPPSNEKARQSLEKAKLLLAEAKANLDEERVSSAVIVAYMAIFHAARSVLFRRGWREKSHECIIRFLEKECPEISAEQIAALEKYKSERTHMQYDVSYSPNEAQAEKMLEFGEEFIGTVEGLP